jgi:predicted RNA-binding Zn-ribbon protein involved in translation (DUF1610 family)
MRCARHPAAETLLTCVTCGTPICPDCMVETPVGMKCPDCGRAPVPAVYRVGAVPLAIAMAASLALGTAAGAVALTVRPGIGLLLLLLALPAGALVGAVAGRAAGGKRGPALALAAAASCAVGFLFGAPQAATLAIAGAPLVLTEALVVVLRRPIYLLFAALTVVTAYWRIH